MVQILVHFNFDIVSKVLALFESRLNGSSNDIAKYLMLSFELPFAESEKKNRGKSCFSLLNSRPHQIILKCW